MIPILAPNKVLLSSNDFSCFKKEVEKERIKVKEREGARKRDRQIGRWRHQEREREGTSLEAEPQPGSFPPACTWMDVHSDGRL